MERTLLNALKEKVGTEVTVAGFVSVRRDQGKMVFFDLRDRTGTVQGVVLPKSPALETAKEVRAHSVVIVRGMVNARPEKNVQKEKTNGDIELEIRDITLLSKAEEIPFELDADISMETRFDYRPFTLRSERDRRIFALQAATVEAYRTSLRSRGFVEFQAPALVGGDAEGGSAVFRVDYFEGKKAFLATSPQLYKQILVGAFERVFTIAKIFRAEKSATTRHLSELTQMDFEMGFIKDEQEVMAMLEEVIRDTVEAVTRTEKKTFSFFGVPTPKLPQGGFPALTLQEAHELLGGPAGDDMEPEQERAIGEWALKEKGSDFVFITKFPTNARAFYTYGEPGGLSRGFDLLFRGLEINSGAQRIHSHAELVTRIRERGMDPKRFAFYLQAFKYGMPPHGGCSTGLERLTMKMVGLHNVKEASVFPRDIHRIDRLLSEPQ